MANTKSAKKAIKTIQRNSDLNQIYKNRIKLTEKKFIKSCNEFLKTSENYRLDETQTKFVMNDRIVAHYLQLYHQRLDLAVKKNVIHKNYAARKKSQSAKKLVECQKRRRFFYYGENNQGLEAIKIKKNV